VGAADITEAAISERLYTADVPQLDLLIRTGGEMRISNFLIWQAAYAELYFTDTLWPDFAPATLDAALTRIRPPFKTLRTLSSLGSRLPSHGRIRQKPTPAHEFQVGSPVGRLTRPESPAFGPIRQGLTVYSTVPREQAARLASDQCASA